jgi:raffinose/stachyose/melibiose transport system permease protein
MRRVRRGPRGVNLPGGVFGLAWLAIVVVPVYWVVVASICSPSDVYARDNPLEWPAHATLANYRLVLERGFLRYFLNSGVVVVGATALVLAVCFLAAYTIIRSRWGFGRSAFSVFLVGLAFPSQAAVIPLFYLMNKLRLYDTLTAIILASAAFAVPITVIILVNFMRDIPAELFESMRVDGASNWRIMWHLALPLSRSALITVGIYDALNVWNGFLFPLVLTQSPSIRVIPLGLYSFSNDLTLNIPAMMAAVVLSAMPILVLYIIGRRHLLAGLTAGFGK